MRLEQYYSRKNQIFLRILDYNTEIWNEYTEENQDLGQDELSKFLYHITVALGAKNILEAGCNIGNNLSEFPNNYNITGIDLNENALKKCEKRYSNFKFQKSSLLKIPFPDSSFDLVFTRGVLIHIAPEDIQTAVEEILRISKKWVLNLEYFGEDNEMIKWKRGDNLLWYRNMKKRWSTMDVKVVLDTEIPKEIDVGKTRLTLIRKGID